MKLYALFTLHETGWGTRTGIGDPATATAAQEKQSHGQEIGSYHDEPNNPGLYDVELNGVPRKS